MRATNIQDLEAPTCFNFVADVLDYWAVQRPEAPALWCVHAGTGNASKLTFQQLSRLSSQAANVLRQHAVKKGDRVLLMLPRIPEWWIAMLGIIRLGAIPVPATLQLTSRDLAFRVETAQVHAVITNNEGAAKMGSFDGLKLLVGEHEPGWIPFDSSVAAASPSFTPEPTRSDEPGLLYFTSATTGEPKMVLHTQASYGLAHRLTGALWLDLRPTDVHWNISDLGWGKAAWSSFYGPWHMGACVFALDFRTKFDPAVALNTLSSFPITTCCAPPTALRLMVRQDLSRWSFPHLRHCVTAGEPLNPEVLNIWRAATGLTLYEAYGQTETVMLIGNFRSHGFPVRPGSMGKANPAFSISVVDSDLRPVPAGHEGEVALRVRPHRPLGLFREYWLNEKETRQKFVSDWYLTGDRASVDEDGYFWFIGRKDDVIKSSGYRIGPFEVESALMEHAAVLDVAVIGKPDPLRGQIVKAYIVCRPGVNADDELKAVLQQHCKSLVAAYKYPREIEFVDELPKTISGKTRHVALRERLASGK